jgi:dTDP-4-dehydrorhamnose 3,5-epimerase
LHQTEMNVLETSLPGVLIIEPKVFGDSRGFFYESWNARAFEAAGIRASFVQDNHSRSAKNVLRGLHYQIRQPQGKLVRVAVGAVFDVAVDLRRSSPTFGKWEGVPLSAENKRMLWIPPGFAHGFLLSSGRRSVQDHGLLDARARAHRRLERPGPGDRLAVGGRAGGVCEGRGGHPLRAGRDLSVRRGRPRWRLMFGAAARQSAGDFVGCAGSSGADEQLGWQTHIDVDHRQWAYRSSQRWRRPELHDPLHPIDDRFRGKRQ